jgi:pyruvate/2-oxoglutarate dehydrogenase complex dihydrolipoamide dehydrogenase (E3) component
MTAQKVDAVILGGGAAGLSVASGLAQAGLDVVLAEPASMGGECLNTGCVPSKALLEVAREVATARHAGRLGLRVEGAVDFDAIRQRWIDAIAAIAPHDSQERFEAMGARVIRSHGRFTGMGEVQIGDEQFRARFVVIATGSHPVIPAIDGMADADLLTNETLWSLERLPESLLVLGGGAMGVEMAQSFARLGSDVTLVHRGAQLLPGFHPAYSAIIAEALRNDGVDVRLGTELERIVGREAVLSDGTSVEAQRLIVAAGRRVDLKAIAPEKIGLEWSAQGIAVDHSLRTNVDHVFALGDCSTMPRLTHAAGAAASVVVRQIAFRLPAKLDPASIPKAIYTDPPIAHMGRQAGTHALTLPFSGNDRASAEGKSVGEFTLIADEKSRIVGARGVGEGVDEMMGWLAIAVSAGVTLKDVTAAIIPYPTRSEIVKALASRHYAPVVFGRWSKRLVGLLARLLP